MRVVLYMRRLIAAPVLSCTKLNIATVCTDQYGTRQIANTNYGVFVRAGLGYCSIIWSQVSGDAYSFTVTGDTEVFPTNLLGKHIYISILLCSNSGATSFSLWGFGFRPISVRVAFVVTLGRFFFQAFQFPPASCHSAIVLNCCELCNGISAAQPTSHSCNCHFSFNYYHDI
jgi:hypothetical protein